LRRFGDSAASGSLFFFPEGTFTPRAGLRAFRLGAFQLASRTGQAVSPIALAGTRQCLRDQSWLPRRGAVRVTFAAPIMPLGDRWAEVLRLRDAARAAILRDCGEPDLEPVAVDYSLGTD